MDLLQKFAHAARAIKEADALLITAGAGMGVDSGLPDFRGQEGFWKAYPPLASLGYSFEEMANPEWFDKDPHLAWAFYGHRLNLYRQILPHPGFTQLHQLARSKPNGFFVFTSNVDGHFQKAGFPADRIVECHGSIHHLQCTKPCSNEIWDVAATPVSVGQELFRAADPLPQCKNCGRCARPNILMFGDYGWVRDRSFLQENRFQLWLQNLPQNASLAIVELGAGMAVPTVRYTSERIAGQFGGTLVRINPRESSVPQAHIGLPCGAAEAIAQLTALIYGP